ncbi:four-carbon acid sugar kinase family protein [Methylobrevis albus]|uniref:Four-carbon acid sugar kinase family protein n=1 Tax=Methylobrevis albus TaxID=2793297 RepID=A0A931I2U3_9HYPH|nr:four-carbon acid sugar kinase family protein [Methylobrevis albus]MBH0238429.1 four-carbon acid sugar kinase family protein [Methylobrevis albus]
MSLLLAIIADDLTGALDTASPFAALGFKVRVAIGPDHLDAALGEAPEVIAVSTNSRALDPPAAAEVAAATAQRLLAAAPARFLKKVDSRLKGNVAAECAAILGVIGAARIVAAPAVPEQGRRTEAGSVVGRGVAAPIDIAAAFAAPGVRVDVADAASAAELDAVVENLRTGDLAAGARGLGAALARKLASERAGGEPGDVAAPAPAPIASRTTLFAIGSRDPITAVQIERLSLGRGIAVVDAPDGALPPPPAGLPLVLRCTDGAAGTAADPDDVAARFAAGVADWVAAASPEALVTGGGDTAFAVFRQLGAGVLAPGGEVLPGLPWMWLRLPNGRRLWCVVKSGGFGADDALSALFSKEPERFVPVDA